MHKVASQKARKNFFQKFVMTLAILVLIFLVFGIVKEYLLQREIDGQIASLEQELDQLNARKTGFLRTIQSLQSDFFVEQEARTKLNLMKPGEKVAVIPFSMIETMVSDKLSAGEQAEQMADRHSILYNAKSWWRYFFSG